MWICNALYCVIHCIIVLNVRLHLYVYTCTCTVCICGVLLHYRMSPCPSSLCHISSVPLAYPNNNNNNNNEIFIIICSNWFISLSLSLSLLLQLLSPLQWSVLRNVHSLKSSYEPTNQIWAAQVLVSDDLEPTTKAKTWKRWSLSLQVPHLFRMHQLRWKVSFGDF